MDDSASAMLAASSRGHDGDQHEHAERGDPDTELDVEGHGHADRQQPWLTARVALQQPSPSVTWMPLTAADCAET